MNQDKILEEITLPVYDKINNRTAFFVNARLEDFSYTDSENKPQRQQGWYITSNGGCDFKLLFLNETNIVEKFHPNNKPLSKEKAIKNAEPILKEASTNPKLTPYFYPKELSNEKGLIDNYLLEKFQDFEFENFDKNIAYTKEEYLIPFIKMEYLFKIFIHIKSLGLNKNDENLTRIEEDCLEAKFICTEIIESELYKQFPNRKIGQQYFDNFFKKNDKYFIYNMKTKDEEFKLCVVINALGEWKFFFTP